MFRCKYRLSDKIVVGAARGAADGAFDDADHGTTIEFTLGFPMPYEKVYDDTLGSEALNDVAFPGAYISVTPSVSDSDDDGIVDLAADGSATVDFVIQKKDKDGNDLTDSGDNDVFFVEVSSGKMDVASSALVNGTKTVTLQPSSDLGKVVEICIRPSDPALPRVDIRIKFR